MQEGNYTDNVNTCQILKTKQKKSNQKKNEKMRND